MTDTIQFFGIGLRGYPQSSSEKEDPLNVRTGAFQIAVLVIPGMKQSLRRINLVFCLLVLPVISLFPPFAGLAQDNSELELDHALTFEFKTPHIDWAQPYA
ncbi:MAG: hypothetical protein C4530_10095 [Desulfobacteraceae bacterium]|nr:MAG: hypothetical protein C4530_10095 [Desulfobacteraceae bacterium]